MPCYNIFPEVVPHYTQPLSSLKNMSTTYTFKYLQQELKLLNTENEAVRNKVFSCGITAAIFLAHRLFSYKKYPKLITDGSEKVQVDVKNYLSHVNSSVQTDFLTDESTQLLSFSAQELIEPLQMRIEELLGLLSNKETNICVLCDKINKLESIISLLEGKQKPGHEDDVEANFTREVTFLKEQLVKTNYTLKLRETKVSSLEAKLIVKEQHCRSLSHELASLKAVVGALQESHQTLFLKSDELGKSLQLKEQDIDALHQQLKVSQQLIVQQEELFSKIASALDCDITIDSIGDGTTPESRARVESAILEHLDDKFRHLDELDTKFITEMESLKQQLKMKEEQFLVRESQLKTKYKVMQMQLDKKEQELISRIKLLQTREQDVNIRLAKIETDMTLIQQWRIRLDEREKSLQENLLSMKEYSNEKQSHFQSKLKELELEYQTRWQKDKLEWEKQVKLLQLNNEDMRRRYDEQINGSEHQLRSLREQIGSAKFAKVQDITDSHKLSHDLREGIYSSIPSIRTPTFDTPSKSTQINRDKQSPIDAIFKTPERPVPRSRTSTPNKTKITKTASSKGSPYSVAVDESKKTVRHVNPNDAVKLSPWSVTNLPQTPEITSDIYVRYYMHN